MNLSVSITGGGDQSKRRELDFYPTPPEVTKSLMNFLNLPKCKIWEPACGTGYMSKVLESYGHTVTSTDIKETGHGVGGVDFIKHVPNIRFDAIITNPPFNIADQFIKKAVENADVVAMLLKSQYWHAKKRFELFKKYPPAYVLPLTWRPDFLGGGAPTMDVAWTVWIKNDNQTKYQPLLK